MNRKAKIEGYAYDVAKRSNSTDSRSAAAEQAHRRRSVTAPYRAEPRSAAWCGKRFPTPEPTATAASTTSAAPGKRQCAQAAPTHARGDRGPARKPAENNKSGKKTTLFVVLGLIVIVYIVGVVAFSQVAYPNTTIAGVDVSFSNASSAATKVNSAWKHYKLTVTGDDFSWTYQPESDEPIVDGEAAAKEIISHNEAFVWPVHLVESLSGKTKTTATSNEVDLDQDVDLSMLSDTFDQKKFEKDLGAAIDEFNEGRSGTFEANSSYDEQAGKLPSRRRAPTKNSTASMSLSMPSSSLPRWPRP